MSVVFSRWVPPRVTPHRPNRDRGYLSRPRARYSFDMESSRGTPGHDHPNILFAPWRMDYIRSLQKPLGDGCFLCEAAAATDDAQRRQRLVLWQSPLSIVLLNRFPYTNG